MYKPFTGHERNERLADDSEKSNLLPNVIEVYGYEVFGVTAFFDFHIKHRETSNAVISKSVSQLIELEFQLS